MAQFIPRRLRDLLDVLVPAPADGQVLTWGAGTGLWAPSSPEATAGDAGLLAWPYDPVTAFTNLTVVAQTIYLTRVPIRRTITPSAAVTNILTGGTGATSLLNCYLGLYDRSGMLRGKTADQAASWSSAGVKSAALAAEPGQSLSLDGNDNYAYVATLVGRQATTPIIFGRTTAATTTVNLLQTPGSTPPARFLSLAAGVNALPSTMSYAACALQLSIWAGLA